MGDRIEELKTLPTRKEVGYSFRVGGDCKKKTEKYEKMWNYEIPRVGMHFSISKPGSGYSTNYNVISTSSSDNTEIDTVELQNVDGETMTGKVVNGKWTVVDRLEDRSLQLFNN